MPSYPDIPIRGGKNEHYTFGHRVMPNLLFQHPDLLTRLASDDPEAFLQSVWDAYSRQWGHEPEAHGMRVRWYRHEQGGLAAAVDMPPPQDVPEPHGLLLVFQPERAFFVIERTSEENIQKFLRTAWVRLSSAGPQTSAPDHAGFLCEWTADGGHRNYRYVAINVGSMLTKVGTLLGLDGKWEPVAASAVRPEEIASAPVRDPEQRMPEDDRRRLDRRVDEIMQGARDERTTRHAIEDLLTVLHDAQLVHGNAFTEITLHRAKVIRLMIRIGDLDRAELYNEDWRYFCHEHRGSRAPETAITYTSWARIIAADPRTTLEHKEKRMRLIHAMRDRMPGGIRQDLPGYDDPEVTAVVSPRSEGA